MQKNEADKDCTFQPERRERSDDPSFQEFLKKQTDHLERKKKFYVDKSKEKEIVEENTLQEKPSISDSSKVIAMNLGPTQERLLAKKDKLNTQSPAREKAEFRAEINVQPPVNQSYLNE